MQVLDDLNICTYNTNVNSKGEYMSDLGEKEQAVLDFVKTYKRENQGTSPSLDEIANGCNLVSRAHSKYYVGRLASKGRLIFHGTRNIQIVDPIDAMEAA